mgnify:CR=1 FL=1
MAPASAADRRLKRSTGIDAASMPTSLRTLGLALLAAMGVAFGLVRGRRVPVLAGMVGAALLDQQGGGLKRGIDALLAGLLP